MGASHSVGHRTCVGLGSGPAFCRDDPVFPRGFVSPGYTETLDMYVPPKRFDSEAQLNSNLKTKKPPC
jgi:hypothetical protein